MAAVKPVEQILHEEVIAGQAARQLLENPLLQEAFRSVEEVITSQIKRSGLNETALHSHLAIALQMLDAIQQAIVQYAETGSMAETTLAELENSK